MKIKITIIITFLILITILTVIVIFYRKDLSLENLKNEYVNEQSKFVILKKWS